GVHARRLLYASSLSTPPGLRMDAINPSCGAAACSCGRCIAALLNSSPFAMQVENSGAFHNVLMNLTRGSIWVPICWIRHSIPAFCYSGSGMAARRQAPLCCGATADAEDPRRSCVDTIRSFGRLADGREVRAYRIGDQRGASAEILDLGGILARLRVPGVDGPVDAVLRLPHAQAYHDDPAFLGTLVGRYGNRIGDSRFVLDGEAHALAANEGRHHLHGGMLGF